MYKETKPKMRRTQIIITEDQFEWLRRQSFLLRKPMSTIFKELLEIAMNHKKQEGADATEADSTIQG